MRTSPPDYEKDARQTLLIAALCTLGAVIAVSYAVLRAYGFLPRTILLPGYGTPISANPYFTQAPDVNAMAQGALAPGGNPMEPSAANNPTGGASPSANSMRLPMVASANKTLSRNRQQQEAFVSVKSYLETLEQTEADKQALLQQVAAQFPQLRAALARPVPDATHTDTPLVETTPDQLARIPEEADLVQGAWSQLIDGFEQHIPPYDCIELHAGYTAHLKAMRDYIAICTGRRVRDRADRVADDRDPAEEKQQAKATLMAETNVVSEALKDVCTRVGLTPDFEITATLQQSQ